MSTSPHFYKETSGCTKLNNSQEPTFQCIPETMADDPIKEEVIKTNNWTKTFKNLLGKGDQNLNVSITDGQ